MIDSILQLQPSLVWRYFTQISEIPHDSGKEEALAQAVCKWAAAAGCSHERDKSGNILIRIPATAGMENAPMVALQAHLDMVCEKNTETSFNFDTDPLKLRIVDGWVMATDTTLGADNGIGLAMGLALMEDSDCVHGPLELLCTLDEETGLNGALELSPNWMKSRIMINTDTEDEGLFIIGCAGGADTDLYLPVNRTPFGGNVFELTVKNLKGGHSGMEINQNLGNAIHLLCGALESLQHETELRIVHIQGGDKHNAIPREATALFVAEASLPSLALSVKGLEMLMRKQLTAKEQHATMTIAPAQTTQPPLDAKSSFTALRLLLSIPHGVETMSTEIENLVESSTNLASVRTIENEVVILTSSRSSNPELLNSILLQISAVGELAGARVHTHTGYPPWEPDFDSPLIPMAEKVYQELFEVRPEFNVIHAGLEGGIIKSKYPGLDVISFGPNIESPHSPSERVEIQSVEHIYRFLCAFLHKIQTS
ncbi:MAG: aminoacyl-histidine dipeptidase [Deltaproteobacteria bacterium]|nr:aminoacyl-histidine dipeptidase [Deltaproteobacteria bacterium]MBN2674541.1 aminoacyl-histidine dipeptidase [Deltaproteobacteria bacterium]